MEELERLIEILKREGLTEITVWEGDRRITVRRDAAVVSHAQSRNEPLPPPEEDEGTFTLAAPLVGTLYLRPSPEDPPFVEEGAMVEPGDTLCVIEAMKVLNEIKAERGGRLVRILVENGTPVEYGQPLFLFEKT